MKKWNYYPMAMHLHCGHQPKASMESHIFNAASLGMEYIRFTPHDTRTGPDQYAVRSFDFARGEAVYADDSGYVRGWELTGEAEVVFDGAGMQMNIQAPCAGGLCEGSAKFYSEGKRQAVSLLADVIVTLDLAVETHGDGQVILDVEMSQRPPDHQPAHIYYCVGGRLQGGENSTCRLPEELPPHTALVPLTVDEDGRYRLRISEDAEKLGEMVGGLDNAFIFLYVRVMAGKGGSACCRIRQLEISVQRRFEEVIARQRKLGDEIGARYGVKPFITAEISGAGQHKNYYSEAVPVIDYAARGFDVTQAEAIAHVKAHGGIFCYNHPLSNGRFLKNGYSPEETSRLVEMEAASLAAARVYGASLMEVGFPEGRGQFSLSDHLRLWDLLSLAGVFVTGCGDSDSHDSEKDWFGGNNFATWIAAEEALEFPISDDVFLESMKAGRAYAGDPVWLKGEVELSASVPGIVALGLAPMNQKDAVQKTSMQELCSVPMGGILAVMDRDTEPRPMSFRVGAVQKGWRICVIVDGEPAAEYVTTEAGAFECSFSVKPLRPVSFARVEMYNENGRCILLTNPIYLVRIAEYAGELPASRCYGGLECFARPWTGEITLPKGIEEIRGTKILHIGDTDSTWYPYFIRLIEVVKPDIILHTGDTSDEVKVGRIPGTRHEYLTKVRVLLEAMDKSGARLIFTSGNNDLPQELHKMVPRMEIYPANSVLTLDGVECRVGHRVMDMTFDKDWTFYGHGLTGEVWHYEDNREGQPCRFNTSWGSFVYCMSEGKFFHLPLPKLT